MLTLSNMDMNELDDRVKQIDLIVNHREREKGGGYLELWTTDPES